MGRRPVFPSDAEIARAVQEIERRLGLELSAQARELGVDAEEILRWQVLAQRFTREREARGWTLKEAAAQVRCAQYRLRAVESGGAEFDVELLARYAEALGLGAFLQAWALANPALAERRGIAAVVGERDAVSAPRERGHPSAPRAAPRAVPDAVYRFRIALQAIAPAVWRRIEVPGNYSFWDLHVAIQDAMGWHDCHLHSFRVLDPESGREAEIGIPDEDFFPGIRQIRAGWQVPLGAWLRRPGDRAVYTYDHGDDWRHDVELESIDPPQPRTTYPRCVDGARACPPEDCGGVPGYEDLLRVLADPSDEQHVSMLEWLGDPYDPAAFSPSSVRFDDPEQRFKLAFGSRKRR
jgi:transcriptional regulator with XRE-family HTH domain